MFAIRHQHGPDSLGKNSIKKKKKNPTEKTHRTQGNVNGYKTKNKCLISFIVRKIQMKSTARSYFSPLIAEKMKKCNNSC